MDSIQWFDLQHVNCDHKNEYKSNFKDKLLNNNAES